MVGVRVPEHDEEELLDAVDVFVEVDVAVLETEELGVASCLLSSS